MICTQEAGKKEEGKDVTSMLASGTRGNYPLALHSQEQKHDLQKSVPVAAFLDQQPSQLEQVVRCPRAEKLPPPLFCQASGQQFPNDSWEYRDGNQPPCLIPSDPTPQTKLRTWQPERSIKERDISGQAYRN